MAGSSTGCTHPTRTHATYARLREIKRAYNPDNLFGRTRTIVPAVCGAAA